MFVQCEGKLKENIDWKQNSLNCDIRGRSSSSWLHKHQAIMNLENVYYDLGTVLLHGEKKKFPIIKTLQNLLWENAKKFPTSFL